MPSNVVSCWDRKGVQCSAFKDSLLQVSGNKKLLLKRIQHLKCIVNSLLSFPYLGPYPAVLRFTPGSVLRITPGGLKGADWMPGMKHRSGM